MYSRFRKKMASLATNLTTVIDEGLNMQSNSIEDIARRNKGKGHIEKPKPIIIEWLWLRVRFFFLHHLGFGYFFHQIRRVINLTEQLNPNSATHKYTENCFAAEKTMTDIQREFLPEGRELNRYLLEMSTQAAQTFAIMYDYSGHAPSSVRNFGLPQIPSVGKVYMLTFERLSEIMGTKQETDHLKNMMYEWRMNARNGLVNSVPGIKQRGAFSYPSHAIFNHSYVPEIGEARDNVMNMMAECYGDENDDELKKLVTQGMYYKERVTTFDSFHDLYKLMDAATVGLISRNVNPVKFSSEQSAHSHMELALRWATGGDVRPRQAKRVIDAAVRMSENFEYSAGVDQTARNMNPRLRHTLDGFQDTVPFIKLGGDLAVVREVESTILTSMTDRFKHIESTRTELRTSNLKYPLLEEFAKQIRQLTGFGAGEMQSFVRMQKANFTIPTKAWNRLTQAMPMLKAAHKSNRPPTMFEFCSIVQNDIYTNLRDWFRALDITDNTTTFLSGDSPHPLFDAQGEPTVVLPLVKKPVSFKDIFDNTEALQNNPNAIPQVKNNLDNDLKQLYMLQIDYLKLYQLRNGIRDGSIPWDKTKEPTLTDLLEKHGCFMKDDFIDPSLTGQPKEARCPSWTTMTPEKWKLLYKDLKAIDPDLSLDKPIPFFDPENNPTIVPRMHQQGIKLGYQHLPEAESGEIPLVEMYTAVKGRHLWFAFDGYNVEQAGLMYYGNRSGNRLTCFHDPNQYTNAMNKEFCIKNGICTEKSYEEVKKNPFIAQHFQVTAKGTEQVKNSLNSFAEYRYRSGLLAKGQSAREHVESVLENMRNVWGGLARTLELVVSDKEPKVPNLLHYIRIIIGKWIRIVFPMYRSVDRPSIRSQQINLTRTTFPNSTFMTNSFEPDVGDLFNRNAASVYSVYDPKAKRHTGRTKVKAIYNTNDPNKPVNAATILEAWKDRTDVFPQQEDYMKANNITNFRRATVATH
ncbi:MAG: hypothetical protein ACK59C_05350 [Holosporales bacterium]